MRTPLVILLFCVVLAGCGDSLSTATKKTRYQCGDLQLDATFASDHVTLEWPNGQGMILPLVPSASGAKYADSHGNEFWTRDGAMFTLAGQPLRNCTAAPSP